MFNIIQYDKRYNKKINDFIISIYVDEYGYVGHKEEIKNWDNSIYQSSGGNFWIAIDNDENIIGTIGLLKHDEENIELKKLYVKKEYRGKGVSKILYENFFEECKRKSYKRIFLSTYNKLETAIHFYVKRRV